MQKNSRNGFTLVELSIVLVVVGLIIGGVLIAVNILQNARVTSAINGLQGIQSAVSTYNQNYGALPGDDAKAKARFESNGVTNSGGGNGVIGAAALADTLAGAATAADGDGAYESAMIWSHLRAAGLVKGSGDIATPQANPFGGIYGVQNGAFSGDDGFALGTNVVCLMGVPGAAARIIDERLDDGNPDAGSVRAGTAITGAPATAYGASNVVVCTGISG